jgi:hypothetical protein
MSEPLKVILIVASIFSSLYVFALAKNIAATGQVNPSYVFPIFLSFIGVFAVGFLIWGIVAMIQSSKRSKIHKPTTRHT